MTRTRLFHSLAVVLLMVAPAMEARAQKSMGQSVPSTTEPSGDTETPPATESKPLAPWKSLRIDEKPTTIQVRRSADSKPVPMTLVKRGNLAITEGDMVVAAHSKTLTGDISMENAIRNPALRWPKVNGKVTVPYALDPSLPNPVRQAITAAIAEFKAKTCVNLVPRTREKDYVSVVAGGGCYSYVGTQQGKQELSLGAGCEYTGTAIHEFMHSLGFMHEQSRPDRDQYVFVNLENAEQGLEGQLGVCQDCTTQDMPYDYASIMHYGAQAFTKNGKDTLVPKQKGAKLMEPYDKPGLSALDVKKIQKLYQCP